MPVAAPPEALKRRRNPALICGSYIPRLEAKCLPGHIADSHLVLVQVEPLFDLLFPCICLVSRSLFRLEYPFLKVAVGPPRPTVLEQVHSLSEQLVAVSGQGLDVDHPGPDRPEPPATGLVAQVNVFVGGADEYALAWFEHLKAAIARP